MLPIATGLMHPFYIGLIWFTLLITSTETVSDELKILQAYFESTKLKNFQNISNKTPFSAERFIPGTERLLRRTLSADIRACYDL